MIDTPVFLAPRPHWHTWNLPTVTFSLGASVLMQVPLRPTHVACPNSLAKSCKRPVSKADWQLYCMNLWRCELAGGA
eukprot:4959231-Pyramimonas_sp.AAC.1